MVEYPPPMPPMNPPAFQPSMPIVDLDVFPPAQQRRWTVLLRAILAIPHLLVLILVGLASGVVAILGWFGALFTGALPIWCADFLRGTLAYTMRVFGYTYLLVDEYPPFNFEVDANYPLRVQFPAPTRLNRWAVLFRFFLALPILILTSWLSTGWMVIAPIFWLILLITGRMPAAVFQATAAVLRSQLRTDAYWAMLTPTYLSQVFGDGPTPTPGELPPPAASPTRPLLVSQAAKVLLWIILILGILWSFFNPAPDYSTNDNPTQPTHIEWPHPTP
ncbi:DUF4389 domain-containing protein [Nocardia tengchongensis]|uniref:DUF4389 domain-containing protein n=1 Tax=Nocardia tengchongensis TaxID=2055889 RepID=UPI002484D0A3|nr:DUF4389 domain-containing protein [Nocardia tengchongensis]